MLAVSVCLTYERPVQLRSSLSTYSYATNLPSKEVVITIHAHDRYMRCKYLHNIYHFKVEIVAYVFS